MTSNFAKTLLISVLLLYLQRVANVSGRIMTPTVSMQTMNGTKSNDFVDGTKWASND